MRLTKRMENGGSDLVPGVTSPQAVEKLAAFEDLLDDLQAEQQALSQKLGELRAQGRESSARFRELLGKKLINSQVLGLFAARGLCVPGEKGEFR